MKRRSFLKHSTVAASSVFMFHTVPAAVLGASAPSNRIGIGMVGTGRQAMHVNFPGFSRIDNCQVVAINDVDAWRMSNAEKIVNDTYASAGKGYGGVKTFDDYRELIGQKDVDAVMISTADHWHAPVTIAAALAGKHVSMEKAFTVAPMHGKAVVEAVKAKGVTGRLDSEFRSLREMNRAVELVHNKAIGDLVKVEVKISK